MSNEEIVKALRYAQTKYATPIITNRTLSAAVDLIESLQAQLTESQRRERAAVEDWKTYEESGQCDVCKYGKGGDCTYPEGGRCKFEWRGPQDAGKGDSNA